MSNAAVSGCLPLSGWKIGTITRKHADDDDAHRQPHGNPQCITGNRSLFLLEQSRRRRRRRNEKESRSEYPKSSVLPTHEFLVADELPYSFTSKITRSPK
ncbi:hypothetical protein F2P81_018307 [Scophthalmus maximus]|uniref:Uncharacterized protein n=1 Tax=Scophthalmus maximus TaxID=52904 RepID=A0A6A4SFL0_SCOMX|nr:hypothetical protein F2P81_018307 [Scophthalmus maximus]